MNLLFGFSGRIGRGQWWLAQLAILVLLVVTVAALVHVGGGSAGYKLRALQSGRLSVILVVLIGATLSLWINFAATIKRYHDLDKSGLWSLMLLVPYIGGLWVLVECGFFSGSSGNNDYGPPPGTDDRADLRGDLSTHISLMTAERSIQQQPRANRMEQQAGRVNPAPPVAQTKRSTGPTGFGRRGR